MLVSIREAEARTRFLGYRVEWYKVFAFTLSAMLAGVAGAHYVPQVGIINPGEFSPANSIEIVIRVTVGGRGLLLGAVLVNGAKTLFTGWFPELWTFALGALFVLMTFYLPRGVLGGLDALGGWRPGPRRQPRGRARRAGPAEGGERLEPAEKSTSRPAPCLSRRRLGDVRRIQGDRQPVDHAGAG